MATSGRMRKNIVMFLELGERIENFDCVHGEQHHKQNLPTYDQS